MEIHWDHLEPIDAAEREAIETRLQKLAEERDDLWDVRIVGRFSEHHHRGAQEVRIVGRIKGREIVAHRTRADLSLALEETVDAFERELRRLRDRRKEHQLKARGAGPPVLGVVDRIVREEGYGFILTDAGEQVYFHQNALSGGLHFETLDDGQRVGLDVEPGDEGPQATFVGPAPPEVP